MAILDSFCESSYWLINWQVYPIYRDIVPISGNFKCLMLNVILADKLGELTCPRGI